VHLVQFTAKYADSLGRRIEGLEILRIIYLLVPRSQNIVPNNKAMINVKNNLTALYGGFLQYDKFCFHRQAMHCV